jgi:transposase
MEQTTGQFSLPTLMHKKVEKLRRKERDSRIHKRLSALLWLNEGYSINEVADLLDVCPRTITNWLALFRAGGLELLCRLDYQGDPG